MEDAAPLFWRGWDAFGLPKASQVNHAMAKLKRLMAYFLFFSGWRTSPDDQYSTSGLACKLDLPGVVVTAVSWASAGSVLHGASAYSSAVTAPARHCSSASGSCLAPYTHYCIT